MSILVTGGAGYIGSHTCVELLNSGYDIVVADNYYNSCPEALNRVKQITGKDFKAYDCDILNRDALDKVFSENKIDAVIHFAGYKAVGESVIEPMKYYHNNIEGTISLCEIMDKHDCRRIVFSSSATVYGAPKEVPIKENFPLSATNPYGRTKLMNEEILQDLYFSDHRWSVILLRYFNPVGAHESGLIGEEPKGIPNNLMPFITKVAIGALQELSVFGSDWCTKDGTGVRDYIHVVDLAKGHIKALSKAFACEGINIYNLGTGKGYSVLDLVRAFEEASGRKIPYKFVERRPGDIAECFADPAKALEELKWKAEFDIVKMCEDSWRWQKNNPEGYNN
ncbi:udp-glucose 4-epimerase [Holotrichia oblita]|nr:udp-glucose 4-epimerase [Holotrichia oblita]